MPFFLNQYTPTYRGSCCHLSFQPIRASSKDAHPVAEAQLVIKVTIWRRVKKRAKQRYPGRNFTQADLLNHGHLCVRCVETHEPLVFFLDPFPEVTCLCRTCHEKNFAWLARLECSSRDKKLWHFHGTRKSNVPCHVWSGSCCGIAGFRCCRCCHREWRTMQKKTLAESTSA